ncbi:MAG: hypothetical protein GX639_01285 [Fibrobacter sp.]|nr:hypothetical protein [Fibrobacter sp.]
MHKIYLILLALTMMLQASVLSLEGHVPPGINPEKLVTEYYRIRNVFDSSFVQDTTAITIIYYKQSDEKRTGVRLPEWGGGGAI